MKLLFLGDWCSSSGFDLPKINHELLLSGFKDCEHTILNFEGPVKVVNHRKNPKVGPHLYQGSSSVEYLTDLGVDYVSLANNHTFDYGLDGVKSTINALEANGIGWFGLCNVGGENKNRVVRLGQPGNGVAVIAAAEREFISDHNGAIKACSVDPISLHKQLQHEKKNGYSTIILLHGGIEHEHLPPPYLRKLTRWLIDNGAEGIVTHHPHVPGFVEMWNNKPIMWSLGDIWMPEKKTKKHEFSLYGYGVEIEFNSKNKINSFKSIPYYIDYDKYEIKNLTKKELLKFESLQEKCRVLIKNNEEYNSWWEEFIKNKSMVYSKKYSLAPIKKQFWNRWFGLNFLLRIWHRRKPSWIYRQLNGLRCETHQEIWLSVLERLVKK